MRINFLLFLLFYETFGNKSKELGIKSQNIYQHKISSKSIPFFDKLLSVKFIQKYFFVSRSFSTKPCTISESNLIRFSFRMRFHIFSSQIK